MLIGKSSFQLIALLYCKGEQWIVTNRLQEHCTFFNKLKNPQVDESILTWLVQLGIRNPEEVFEKLKTESYVSFILDNYPCYMEAITTEDFGHLVVLSSVSEKSTEEFSKLLWKEFDCLVDSIHDGIWLIDNQGITLRVNKSMERIAGVRAEDVVGKHVAAAVEMGYTETCITLKALEKKKPITMLDYYTNGVSCLNTSTPIFDENGEVWRVIACIRDITELEFFKKRLLDAEKKVSSYSIQYGKEQASQVHSDFIGFSESFLALQATLAKVSDNVAPLLFLGETGTGKSTAAKMVHECGIRKDKPFVNINCGAIPTELLESELFGYEKGAFTGASDAGKKGVFELADGGTLFLDEIAELPLAMQVKLLHVLDGSGFRRVGGITVLQPQVRIIVATNKNLEEQVANNLFREDLYYRLRVIVVEIPSLRERSDDIPYLAQSFLDKGNAQYGTNKKFSKGLLAYLKELPWHGNIRELRATVEFLSAMSEYEYIDVSELPAYMQVHIMGTREELQKKGIMHVSGHLTHTLKDAVEELERKMISKAMMDVNSTYKVAKILKISQSSVVRKMKKYGIGISEIHHEN